MLSTLVEKNRSYRRFQQDFTISTDVLERLVDLARLSPSAANKQPLRYVLVSNAENCAKVFSCLAWAGYLPDWAGPREGERPSAYIVMLSNPKDNPKPETDVGIA